MQWRSVHCFFHNRDIFFNKTNIIFVANGTIEVRKLRTEFAAIGLPTDERRSCASRLTINFEIFDLRSVSCTLYACEQCPPTPEHYIYSSIQPMYVRMYIHVYKYIFSPPLCTHAFIPDIP